MPSDREVTGVKLEKLRVLWGNYFNGIIVKLLLGKKNLRGGMDGANMIIYESLLRRPY